jgi:sporulation protein YabP
MGNIDIKGEKLEIIKLDTMDGQVKIKGKINSLIYLDQRKNNKEESFIAKLFK